MQISLNSHSNTRRESWFQFYKRRKWDKVPSIYKAGFAGAIAVYTIVFNIQPLTGFHFAEKKAVVQRQWWLFEANYVSIIVSLIHWEFHRTYFAIHPPLLTTSSTSFPSPSDPPPFHDLIFKRNTFSSFSWNMFNYYLTFLLYFFTFFNYLTPGSMAFPPFCLLVF